MELISVSKRTNLIYVDYTSGIAGNCDLIVDVTLLHNILYCDNNCDKIYEYMFFKSRA